MVKEIKVQKKVDVPGERETKAKFIHLARQVGVEDQLKTIMTKYDNAVKGARNEYERQHIAAAGMAEIYKILGIVNPLVMDGKEILPGKPGWEEAERQQRRLVKLD